MDEIKNTVDSDLERGSFLFPTGSWSKENELGFRTNIKVYYPRKKNMIMFSKTQRAEENYTFS